jgi:hypothetical protein
MKAIQKIRNISILSEMTSGQERPFEEIAKTKGWLKYITGIENQGWFEFMRKTQITGVKKSA